MNDARVSVWVPVDLLRAAEEAGGHVYRNHDNPDGPGLLRASADGAAWDGAGGSPTTHLSPRFASKPPAELPRFRRSHRWMNRNGEWNG